MHDDVGFFFYWSCVVIDEVRYLNHVSFSGT